MTTHAIKTTQNEIDNGYRELSRLLQGGQGALAVKHSFYLAKTDATSLWNFIKAYVSLELNHRHTSELLTVNALWSNWVQDPSDVFIAHAVLTVANATKNRSESVLKYMP
jgi:hypothetical protein